MGVSFAMWGKSLASTVNTTSSLLTTCVDHLILQSHTDSEWHRQARKMTAAVYRSGTFSLAVPPTQNSAPVLEFNCLYTRDVRRKQKRWQDGFLRFHTFNKRVMLYDVPRNFIGDTHWKASEELQDGDEVMLEKDGVMIQVAESVGRTDTDLTGLRKSKTKSLRENDRSSPARPQQTSASVMLPSVTPKTSTQLKHRSLNTLLGTPKGPIGKAALPAKSPFEERHCGIENEAWEEGRARKRQRVEVSNPWVVTRTTGATSPEKLASAKTASAANRKKHDAAESRCRQPRLVTKEIIDLCTSTDENTEISTSHIASERARLPGLHPKEALKETREPGVTHIRSSSPAFQVQRLSAGQRANSGHDKIEYLTGARHLRRAAGQDQHWAPPCQSDQLQSASPSRVEESIHPADSLDKQRDGAIVRHHESHAKSSVPRSNLGRALRVSSGGQRKKILLCQEQLSTKTVGTSPYDTEHVFDPGLSPKLEDVPKNWDESSNQRKRLEERLAKIAKKRVRNCDKDTLSNAFNKPGFREALGTADVLDAEAPAQHEAASLAQLDATIMPQLQTPLLGPLRDVLSPDKKTAASQRAGHQTETSLLISDATSPHKTERQTGAPMRIGPSQSKAPAQPQPKVQPMQQGVSTGPQQSIPSKPRQAQSKQRAVNLNVTSNGTSTVVLSKPFQRLSAPAAKALKTETAPDPWSREAFDLFTWRPPGWDEEGWCVGAAN